MALLLYLSFVMMAPVEMTDRQLCTTMRREMTLNRKYEGPHPIGDIQVDCRRKTVEFYQETDLEFTESDRETWKQAMQTVMCDNELFGQMVRRGWRISFLVSNAGEKMTTEVTQCP